MKDPILDAARQRAKRAARKAALLEIVGTQCRICGAPGTYLTRTDHSQYGSPVHVRRKGPSDIGLTCRPSRILEQSSRGVLHCPSCHMVVVNSRRAAMRALRSASGRAA